MRDVYWRRCKFVNVVDGDTVDVVTDLSRYLTTRERLRLLGVNTPEVHAKDEAVREKAATATHFTATWFTMHVHEPMSQWPYNLRTEKDDAFGRYLAEIECEQGHSLNAELLSTGLAVPYKR